MTLDRRYPDRPFLAASVAVFRDGKVLLASRSKPPMTDLFTLPGGLVEPGETLAAAALRELQEEVGIEAEIIGFLCPVEIVERDEAGRVSHHFVVCAHAARWVAGEAAVSAEAKAVRWVDQADIGQLATTPGLQAVLDRAFALDAMTGPMP